MAIIEPVVGERPGNDLLAGGWGEFRLVEQAQPRAIGSPAHHLGPGARTIFRRVEVRAISPLMGVGSGLFGSNFGALGRILSHNARMASRPTVTCPGGWGLQVSAPSRWSTGGLPLFGFVVVRRVRVN